jgi:hypothetical protein
MSSQPAAGRSGDNGAETRIMRMLEHALAPVDPPSSFVDQLESRLADVEAAALETLEGLSDWELDAMRDPRNWVRPVAALAVGTAAGTALVVLGMRRSRRRRPGLRGFAEQGGRSIGGAVSSARSLIR